VLGIDERELAVIFTVQTAGEALNVVYLAVALA